MQAAKCAALQADAEAAAAAGSVALQEAMHAAEAEMAAQVRFLPLPVFSPTGFHPKAACFGI